MFGSLTRPAARFPQHPLLERRPLPRRHPGRHVQLLDRHLAADRAVLGEPHDAHAAAADLLQDRVSAGDEPLLCRGSPP
jgi:hypothetical protein